MNPPRRLRIAVLNRHFGYRFGGAESYSAAIVEELASRHEVHVFAQEIEHNHPGVSYHRISCPMNKPRWINQVWFAYQTWLQTRQNFDVVHSHENTWHGDVQTIHVRPMRLGLFHGLSPSRRLLRWLSLFTSPRLMAYWFLEMARLRPKPGKFIVATSEQVKQETLQGYPASAACMHVITPGVRVPTALADTRRNRQTLSLPQDVPLALFVANDYAKKGLPTLLQALSHMPSIHLAVVGNGQHIPAFQRLGQQLGVVDRVHFLGSMPDVTPAYEAADLLVHPTTEDTYGMVVLEAMAHGLPTIVSRTPYCGISSDLTHATQALLMDNPGDASELTRHLTALLDNPALHRRLQDAGRRFAQQHGWQTTAHQYEQLFLQSQKDCR